MPTKEEKEIEYLEREIKKATKTVQDLQRTLAELRMRTSLLKEVKDTPGTMEDIRARDTFLQHMSID